MYNTLYIFKVRKKTELHKDEIVLLKSRSSIWFFIMRLLRIIIFITLPLTGIFMALIFLFLRDGFWLFSLITVPIILLLALWYQYSLWKDPSFLLTNKRIIFECERSLWSSRVVEINFKNISDIVVKKSTFVESILGYGAIEITPVSGSGKFEIKYMPKSREIVNKIMEVYNQDPLHSGTIETFLEHNPDIVDYFKLNRQERDIITKMESENNRGTFAVLKKHKVFCILRRGKINFPPNTICSLPSLRVHKLIAKRFATDANDEDILLVGA